MNINKTNNEEDNYWNNVYLTVSIGILVICVMIFFSLHWKYLFHDSSDKWTASVRFSSDSFETIQPHTGDINIPELLLPGNVDSYDLYTFSNTVKYWHSLKIHATRKTDNHISTITVFIPNNYWYGSGDQYGMKVFKNDYLSYDVAFQKLAESYQFYPLQSSKMIHSCVVPYNTTYDDTYSFTITIQGDTTYFICLKGFTEEEFESYISSIIDAEIFHFVK